MKWINASESMPNGSNIIFRRIGDNNTIIVSGDLSMKIHAVQQLNLKKSGNHQLPFEIDMSKFEWLYEGPASEEDTAFVIYDTKRKTFLDKGEFFTEKIRNARTFSSKEDAERSMNYYVKIYSQTTRKEFTESLVVLPVEIQTTIKK